MQQLTGPGVKGNVRASARNIKISDKGAIVVWESLNLRWIHRPLSLTNQPGAMQHPWIRGGKEEDKPKDPAWNHPEPAFRGWKLGNYSLCLARSGAPAQRSLRSSRLSRILCPWKPGQASRKAGAELPKPPRATLKLQETGHGLCSCVSRPFYSSSELCWGEAGAETALPILFCDSSATHCAATALIFAGEAPQELSLIIMHSPCSEGKSSGRFLAQQHPEGQGQGTRRAQPWLGVTSWHLQIPSAPLLGGLGVLPAPGVPPCPAAASPGVQLAEQTQLHSRHCSLFAQHQGIEGRAGIRSQGLCLLWMRQGDRWTHL